VLCALSPAKLAPSSTPDIYEYLDIFQQPVNQLDPGEVTLNYFQQDGAACHMSLHALGQLKSFFLLIGLHRERILASPVSRHDSTGLDFFQ
jgi:hypothetical protein